MSGDSAILSSVKSKVQLVIPGAKVLLFGSRAYGLPTDESDWDFLILTSKPVTTSIKNEIHQALFPVSVQIGAFINTLTVQEDDWANNPSYYSLQQTISKGMLQI
jgi:uncharacterized protein